MTKMMTTRLQEQQEQPLSFSLSSFLSQKRYQQQQQQLKQQQQTQQQHL
jgi:mannitol-specific phosphotransferase system IIBC component